MAANPDEVADAQADADLAVAELITTLAEALKAEVPKGMDSSQMRFGSLALSRIMAAQVGVAPDDDHDER